MKRGQEGFKGGRRFGVGKAWGSPVLVCWFVGAGAAHSRAIDSTGSSPERNRNKIRLGPDVEETLRSQSTPLESIPAIRTPLPKGGIPRIGNRIPFPGKALEGRGQSKRSPSPRFPSLTRRDPRRSKLFLRFPGRFLSPTLPSALLLLPHLRLFS